MEPDLLDSSIIPHTVSESGRGVRNRDCLSDLSLGISSQMTQLVVQGFPELHLAAGLETLLLIPLLFHRYLFCPPAE